MAAATGKSRKRFSLILLYGMLIAPWIVFGAIQALKTNANSPLDWVDSDFEPRREYDRFSDLFGAGDVVVLSWPGCRVDEPRLDTLTRSLRESPAFFDDGQWLFQSVISGRETLATMTRPPMSCPTDEALRRLQGSLLGPDGRTTCIVIGFNEAGLKQRGRLVPLIRAAALRYCGAEKASQHLAGPIMDGYEVDQASQSTMNCFAPLSSIIIFCICVLCLDSLYAAILVFGLSCVCQAVALSILHYSGGSMTALLIVLPPLIQVLAIAGGIHLINYYFDATEQISDQTTARSRIARAIGVGWLPCVLSSATTAIGLGSLAVSGLVAVREFGIYAAIGVSTTVAVLLVFLPGIIAKWPLQVPDSGGKRLGGGVWQVATDWQVRFGTWISLAAATLVLGLGLGVSQLEASVRIETLFDSDSRLLSDYAWIETHVGSLVPIEVVTRFGEDCGLSGQEKIELLRRLQDRLAGTAQVEAVTSCLDFLPATPLPLTGEVAERFLDQSKPLLLAANYLAIDEDGEDRWRVTAHVSALGDGDYGVILNDIRESLQRELPRGDGDPASQVSLELSGLMPLVHEIQNQLLHDLFASFLIAFVLIAIVMTIVQAGVASGLLSMVPNVFPALTLFGALGWMGRPIDIGSIMTASVAMGIAVDDTLHFLTFFQRRFDAGATRRAAVLAAYQHCGRAMIQTTLICGAGLAIFAFSDFVPTARFAWMMVALLSAALVGDLVILPAMILSPLGRVFGSVSGADLSGPDLGHTGQHTDVRGDIIRIDHGSSESTSPSDTSKPAPLRSAS